MREELEERDAVGPLFSFQRERDVIVVLFLVTRVQEVRCFLEPAAAELQYRIAFTDPAVRRLEQAIVGILERRVVVSKIRPLCIKSSPRQQTPGTNAESLFGSIVDDSIAFATGKGLIPKTGADFFKGWDWECVKSLCDLPDA